jgi:hypothetical protein
MPNVNPFTFERLPRGRKVEQDFGEVLVKTSKKS